MTNKSREINARNLKEAEAGNLNKTILFSVRKYFHFNDFNKSFLIQSYIFELKTFIKYDSELLKCLFVPVW